MHHVASRQQMAMPGVGCAGRNPTKVLYSVGFEASGRITALDIRGWMQCGALLDLAFNDAGVLQLAIDQVRQLEECSYELPSASHV